ncbi:MAG TPA: sigma-54 dependent transcriptional regulator [Bryobacteraceae bacterium]|nr:sigma-54 dependent transcriptional regulator [Bryobacteraceae bacterium]
MTPVEKPLATLVAIDDDPESLKLVTAALKQQPLQVLTATDPRSGLELIRGTHPDILLLDLVMPEMSGMEVLERTLELSPETEVVLVTGHYSTESAVEAIRKGASDYLNKPLSVSLLRERVNRLIEQARRRQAVLRLDSELLHASQFEGMIGRSPAMLQVFDRVRRVAPHFRTALVTGATGTGKELVAAALHHLSPVSSGRFAVCNCAAVVETLVESELFGHVKGAFTGAMQDKIGLFEYASGGALLLDEIGDMPLETQSKLLRALEYGELQRVGSPAVRKVDVRVIAATNHDVHDLIEQKRFRQDLYYRLASVEIRLPRLVERLEDLPLLVRHFVDLFAAQYHKPLRGLTPRAQIVLAQYPWPGNVRELRSVIGSAAMMAESEWIDARDLPDPLRAGSSRSSEDAELLPLAEVERRHVLRVLERAGGNKLRAAKILGIHRATLYRFLGQNAGDGESGPA